MSAIAEPATAPLEQRTEHPYIVRVAGVCGGRPIVRGSRIAVWHIARLFKAGSSPDDICQEFSQLPPAGVYDAISYYMDHQAEVEQDIAENRIEDVLARNNLKMDNRGVFTFPVKQ